MRRRSQTKVSTVGGSHAIRVPTLALGKSHPQSHWKENLKTRVGLTAGSHLILGHAAALEGHICNSITKRTSNIQQKTRQTHGHYMMIILQVLASENCTPTPFPQQATRTSKPRIRHSLPKNFGQCFQAKKLLWRQERQERSSWHQDFFFLSFVLFIHFECFGDLPVQLEASAITARE